MNTAYTKVKSKFISMLLHRHIYPPPPPHIAHAASYCEAALTPASTAIKHVLHAFTLTQCSSSCVTFLFGAQEQYVFIHDALEEFITCGDTSVGVANLRIVITKLNKALSDTDDDSTHFDKQFRVSKSFRIIHIASSEISNST